MFSSSKNESKGIEDINPDRLNHKSRRLDIFSSYLMSVSVCLCVCVRVRVRVSV